jgi:hypothetical protein
MPDIRSRSVTPRMVVSDPKGAVAFLRAVFGGVGEVWEGRPTEVAVGDSLIMVSGAGARDLFPAFLDVIRGRRRGAVARSRHTPAVAYDTDLAEQVRALLGTEQGVTEKRMFGGLAFLLEGHMAVAANSRGALMVRIDPSRADELLARPGVEPMVMRGRPLTGWLEVDTTGLDDAAVQGWVGEGVSYVRSLPPK